MNADKCKKRRYCIEDYSNIENYDIAFADNFKHWEIHHRLETHTSEGITRPPKARITKKELIALKMYYNRPASELIFLPRNKHLNIHDREYLI